MGAEAIFCASILLNLSGVLWRLPSTGELVGYPFIKNGTSPSDFHDFHLVWESEEWLKKNAKPVGPAGVGSLNPGNAERNDDDGKEGQEAMEE